MTRILFVCHGNICRSPMAEFVFKKLASDAGVSDRFSVASAATTSEEIGNPVYPPVRQLLAQKGISTRGKAARRITKDDYSSYDYIIGMDEENMRDLMRFYDNDPEGKIYRMLPDRDVADPWWTGEFETAYDDILAGCKALLERLV